MKSLGVRCFAKINRRLLVRDRRPDGFHELLLDFQTIALHDRLHVAPGEGFELELSGPQSEGLSQEQNSVLAAARLLQDELGRAVLPGARFRLEKHVPSAAGLGGGSSDATGALLGLLEATGARLPAERVHALAAELGSDMAFFLEGGRRQGTGRGELLEPLPEEPSRHLLLVLPPRRLSTAEVFGTHAELVEGGALTLRASHDYFFPEGDWTARTEDRPWNDLWPAALKLAPELAELDRVLRLAWPHADVGLSGSGPSLFALGAIGPERPSTRTSDLTWLATRTVTETECLARRFFTVE
ncbi:MAG: 4-(cytidine 5'-diphospho)-2-C-methyl-D-erythritol kinase [Acidobacteriota bacterium]